MDFDFNALNLRTFKVDRIRVGPEWRTENFFPAWRNISYSRIYYPVSGEGLVADGGSFVKNSQRLLLSLAFELTAVINIGFFVLCSVFVLDVNTYWGRELAIFLILVINTALFCGLLCALIKSITALASLSVLITVLDIFICPIFFDFYIQKTPQLFLPNAYYINSVHSNDYFRYSLIYMAVLACMTLCLYVRKRKQ